MSHVVGASMVVFSVDRRWNTIYFWLAQERFIPEWPAGSLTWSDFGGSMNPGDQGDTARCASREFQEESMACIPLTPREDRVSDKVMCTHGARRDTIGVVNMLHRRNFTLRVDTRIHTDSVYTTYVKQVPWRPGCRDMFERLFQGARGGTIAATHPAVDQGGHVPETHMEKACIRMFSIQQLRRMITRVHRGGNHGHIEARLRRGFHLRLQKIAVTATACYYVYGF